MPCDVRLLTQDNGGTLLLTMYDNGPRDVPEYSRAVSYLVDEAAMTATQVWEYRHSPDLYTWATGSSQLLDNGNYAIDWGGIGQPLMPFYTEIDPQTSSKVLEMQFVHGLSYRATRHRWQGKPAEPPTLMVANQDNGSGHGSTAVATSPSLHFSWNGATGVVGWEVLVGEREGVPMTVTRHVERKHFEDGVSTSELVDLVEAVRNSAEESEGSAAECCVWQVVPLMADGTKGKPSNTVTIRST
ncbi:unnamed protein product [Vitrella brassicaformis CCMP3155]|uniref:Uncharacterized protein n=1 Tax=Vitrella brassicaformis (strain CCMP3155) TaxID=1169540 RepID=A0A0G4EWH8_VITBC|nr:unnamed protein product [Vitrella brassicaformis CCMP3155]|eukprot:CEM03317.1 unnamed protein product [Vitrella brassicaformis CCMP3155]